MKSPWSDGMRDVVRTLDCISLAFPCLVLAISLSMGIEASTLSSSCNSTNTTTGSSLDDCPCICDTPPLSSSSSCLNLNETCIFSTISNGTRCFANPLWPNITTNATASSCLSSASKEAQFIPYSLNDVVGNRTFHLASCAYVPRTSMPLDCLSATHNTIQTLGRGTISLKQLVRGDMVLGPKGYEPILGFFPSLRRVSTPMFYVGIEMAIRKERDLPLSNVKTLVVLSGNHRIFLADGKDVPATNVRIGDAIRMMKAHANAPSTEFYSASVIGLHHIPVDQIIAPITPSGHLMLNGGVDVSIYAIPGAWMRAWSTRVILPLLHWCQSRHLQLSLRQHDLFSWYRVTDFM